MLLCRSMPDLKYVTLCLISWLQLFIVTVPFYRTGVFCRIPGIMIPSSASLEQSCCFSNFCLRGWRRVGSFQLWFSCLVGSIFSLSLYPETCKRYFSLLLCILRNCFQECLFSKLLHGIWFFKSPEFEIPGASPVCSDWLKICNTWAFQVTFRPPLLPASWPRSPVLWVVEYSLRTKCCALVMFLFSHTVLQKQHSLSFGYAGSAVFCRILFSCFPCGLRKLFLELFRYAATIVLTFLFLLLKVGGGILWLKPSVFLVQKCSGSHFHWWARLGKSWRRRSKLNVNVLYSCW